MGARARPGAGSAPGAPILAIRFSVRPERGRSGTAARRPRRDKVTKPVQGRPARPSEVSRGRSEPRRGRRCPSASSTGSAACQQNEKRALLQLPAASGSCPASPAGLREGLGAEPSSGCRRPPAPRCASPAAAAGRARSCGIPGLVPPWFFVLPHFRGPLADPVPSGCRGRARSAAAIRLREVELQPLRLGADSLSPKVSKAMTCSWDSNYYY